jgi:ABC-2 type transport system ATP-binding protein
VIALERVSARRKSWSVRHVTIDWGPGVHAVVGTFADGCSLLLALIVGAARARTGRVRVLDGGPTDARIRPQIARLGIEPSLPEALRVDEALALAAVVRGDPPRAASERLSVLGLESLARRPLASLSRGEGRGVALAEGLTSSRVRVIAVEEPFASSDARAASRIAEALRNKGLSGCAVVVTTASVREAGDLADDCVFMRAGEVVGTTSSLQSLGGFAPGVARLVIIARDATEARGLVAALASHGAVSGVELDANLVRIRGADRLALARAAGAAAVQANSNVVEIRDEPLSLDEARAPARRTPELDGAP